MTSPATRGRYRVEISPCAETDLEEIADVIAADSPVNAVRFIARVRKASQSLKRFPNRGELALEGIIDGHASRNLYVGNYRILYVVTGQSVWILGVRHKHRLPLVFNQ